MTLQERQYGNPTYQVSQTVRHQIVDIKPSERQQILHKLSKQTYQNGHTDHQSLATLQQIHQEERTSHIHQSVQQVVKPQPEHELMQWQPKSVQRSPHQHCQQYKIYHRPFATSLTVCHPRDDILHRPPEHHLARLLAPPFSMAVHLCPVRTDNGHKLRQHILAVHTLMFIAVIPTEIIHPLADSQQSMDNIVITIEKEIHPPGLTLLVILEWPQRNLVPVAVYQRQHTATAKKHRHRHAGFQPLAHLHQQEIVGAIRQ